MPKNIWHVFSMSFDAKNTKNPVKNIAWSRGLDRLKSDGGSGLTSGPLESLESLEGLGLESLPCMASLSIIRSEVQELWLPHKDGMRDGTDFHTQCVSGVFPVLLVFSGQCLQSMKYHQCAYNHVYIYIHMTLITLINVYKVY